MGSVGLQRNKGGIRLGMTGGQKEIDRHLRRTARFKQAKLQEAVIDSFDVPKFFKHRIAGNIEHTTGDDLADFTLGMHTNQINEF